MPSKVLFNTDRPPDGEGARQGVGAIFPMRIAVVGVEYGTSVMKEVER